ncbi:cleft lip and palate transmembrane protein 1-like protein [Sitophilus oryzae]|uniref:Lipid scramblase CLPTM1L n=1 Tax=Sitophilus oryzae TaxID=7048 RepID=A0A6J2Y0U3_SITOR|nr:cleft lip and palate transmembrane protein 1-like protein [Sitophilus oryzae]
MKPSLTTILATLFFFVIAHSIWSMFNVWKAPVCSPTDICFHSYLNDNPPLDMVIYVDDKLENPVFYIKDFDYRNSFEENIEIDIPRKVRRNGTMYINFLLLPSGKNNMKLRTSELKRHENRTNIRGRLTEFAVPQSAAFNLLKNNKVKQVYKPVTHIRSKYSVMMCTEELHLPHKNIPFEIAKEMRINSRSRFLPLVSLDFLSLRLQDLEEVTEDTRSVTLKFAYKPISLGKMRFVLQMEASLKQFLTLGFSDKDLDEVKGVFADTNLYLLSATMIIGTVHVLLDFLSFKNDVSFWKSQTSMAGLSTRTVLWRAFSQGVVFLFLLDEGTSLLVLIPAGIATLIEVWKVSKVCKTNVSISLRGFKFNHDNTESAAEAETKKYDKECMKYLSYLLYPLCVAAAIYSLLYQPHKSWYSWTLNSLVNGVYAFGFLFMLPQLFINYRLKSVAALPWRAFTYRAFNTFIDDIFAFIITMPTAHRVACFRDDVIFLIYLYQRWLYPVDNSRTDDISGEVISEKNSNSAKAKNKKEK